MTRWLATPRPILTEGDARHDSDAFELTRPFALTVIGNTLAYWNHQQLGMELVSGVDADGVKIQSHSFFVQLFFNLSTAAYSDWAGVIGWGPSLVTTWSNLQIRLEMD